MLGKWGTMWFGWIGAILAIVGGAGIIYVGISYSVAPLATARNFGFRGEPAADAIPWMHIKGVRDIVSGVLVLVLLLVAPWHIVGWAVLIAALTPIGDALTIVRHRGRPKVAITVHCATALGLVVSAWLLFAS
jgi:hypothetical protein